MFAWFDLVEPLIGQIEPAVHINGSGRNCMLSKPCFELLRDVTFAAAIDAAHANKQAAIRSQSQSLPQYDVSRTLKIDHVIPLVELYLLVAWCSPNLTITAFY